MSQQNHQRASPFEQLAQNQPMPNRETQRMPRGGDPKREHDFRVHSKGLMINRHYRK